MMTVTETDSMQSLNAEPACRVQSGGPHTVTGGRCGLQHSRFLRELAVTIPGNSAMKKDQEYRAPGNNNPTGHHISLVKYTHFTVKSFQRRSYQLNPLASTNNK